MIVPTAPTLEGRRIVEHAGPFPGKAAMSANAAVGVDLDYEVPGDRGSMLMVSATGMAVVE